MKKVNLFDPSASRKPTISLFEPDPKPRLQAVPGDASNRGSNVCAPDGSQPWVNASLGSHNRPTTMSYLGKGWHHYDQMPPMSNGKNNSRIWSATGEPDQWRHGLPPGPFLGSSDPLALIDPWQREVGERTNQVQLLATGTN